MKDGYLCIVLVSCGIVVCQIIDQNNEQCRLMQSVRRRVMARSASSEDNNIFMCCEQSIATTQKLGEV